MKDGIYSVQKLSRDEIVDIDILENYYNQTENIFFKIDPQVLTADYDKSCHILYYVQNALKGYASLNCFDGAELECTIILENDETIFYEIYNIILQKARERMLKRLLFIIDARHTFLINVVKRAEFQFSFAEYRMNFDRTKFCPDKDMSITIQDSTCDDIDVITYLEQNGFGKSLEVIEMDDIDLTNIRIAKINDKIIGKMKVEDIYGTIGIYGFVVDPKLRGQGLGRKIFNSVIEEILEGDFKKLYLEVETENSVALHLYKSVGFYIQTRFDYYEYKL